MLAFLYLFAIFGLRLYTLSTGAAAERARFQEITRTPLSLRMLSMKTKQLQSTVHDIDSLSMNELRRRLSDISFFFDTAQVELENQQRDWQQLNLMLSANADKYKTLKTDIERLNAVKADQLRLAASIVARENSTHANRSFYIGLLISFPLGVISSFLAAFAWERFLLLRETKTQHSKV